LNNAKNCLVKLYNSSSFLCVVYAGKKQPKQVVKMAEIRKKVSLRCDDDIFMTNFDKIHKF